MNIFKIKNSKGHARTPNFALLQCFLNFFKRKNICKENIHPNQTSIATKKTMPKLVCGFTLIELLVVISIIALLSSVVLASLKNAREKAQGSAFRTEVDQFITALELYRSENNDTYPGEEQISSSDSEHFEIYASAGINTGGNYFADSSPESIDLWGKIKKYLPRELRVPKSSTVFYYFIRTTSNEWGGGEPGGWAGCANDTKRPRYFIIIQAGQTGFEDWEYYKPEGADPATSLKCFSLK